MYRSNLTAEQVRSLFDYDPLDGRLLRKVAAGGAKAGDEAGTLINGYISVQASGSIYRAHRLIWLYMTGKWPDQQIDHIDGVRNNNKWANLRCADHILNAQNRHKAGVRSSTGLLGVVPNHKRWSAQIRVDGHRKYLGTYDTPEQAHAVYCEAKRKLHPGCTI